MFDIDNVSIGILEWVYYNDIKTISWICTFTKAVMLPKNPYMSCCSTMMGPSISQELFHEGVLQETLLRVHFCRCSRLATRCMDGVRPTFP
jgi:hypothetical protein